MEQTFSSGKPPAGEPGMCVTKHGQAAEYPQFWDGREFGWSEDTFRDAYVVRGHGCQNRPWRWATLRELTDAGIPEAEARTMVHESQLPEKPAEGGWGPWIGWQGGECPIPWAKAGEYEVQWVGGSITSWTNGLNATQMAGWGLRDGVTAYRLKLTASQVGAPSTGQAIPCDPGWRDWNAGDAQPPVDRVDIIRVAAGIKGASLTQVDNVPTVSQYWGIGSFVRKWRPAVVAAPVANPNAQMISRDGSAPARSWSDMGALMASVRSIDERALFVWGAYPSDDECPGALTCAPMAYRLGLGRAF